MLFALLVCAGLASATLPADSHSHEARALVSDDECNATQVCTLSLLQRRLPSRLGSQGQLASAAPEASAAVTAVDEEEKEILRIIRNAFVNVSGPGFYLGSNRKTDNTWEVCGTFDWSSLSSFWRDQRSIFSFGDDAHPHEDAAIKDLGAEYCRDIALLGLLKDYPTCAAAYAVLQATAVLQERFPDRPKFANAFVVNWGELPSWLKGTVGQVNWTAEPPRAKLLDNSGIVGYALCNIARVLLTQSPNQWHSGTCSHLAVLDALSHKAPTKMLEMAIRLLWTGRTSPGEEFPCPYIYERQPGLVPWQDKQGNWHPSEAKNLVTGKMAACTGAAADCDRGGPAQPAGLPYMWSLASVSEVETSNYGSCQGKEIAPLVFPGMSPILADQVGEEQAGTDATALWACQHFIDPKGGTCRLRFNVESCEPGLSVEECEKLATTHIPASIDNVLQDFTDAEPDNFPILSALSDALPAGSIGATEAKLRRIGAGDLDAGFRLYSNYYTEERSDVPSATSELLSDACKAAVAILSVDATPLDVVKWPQGYRGQVPYYGIDSSTASGQGAGWLRHAKNMAKRHGNCDHMVVLDHCDEEKNEYVIWSWGDYFKLTREVLLGSPLYGKLHGFNSGMICAVIQASNITWVEGDQTWAPSAIGERSEDEWLRDDERQCVIKAVRASGECPLQPLKVIYEHTNEADVDLACSDACRDTVVKAVDSCAADWFPGRKAAEIWADRCKTLE